MKALWLSRSSLGDVGAQRVEEPYKVSKTASIMEGSNNRTLQLVNSRQPRTVQQSYICSPRIKWRSLPRHQREILQVEKSLAKIKNILFLQWLRFRQWLKGFRLPILKQTTEKNNREGPKSASPAVKQEYLLQPYSILFVINTNLSCVLLPMRSFRGICIWVYFRFHREFHVNIIIS